MKKKKGIIAINIIKNNHLEYIKFHLSNLLNNITYIVWIEESKIIVTFSNHENEI